MSEDSKESSFPECRYPSLRNTNFRSCHTWLLGKSMDEGAEGLWRIHDGLYDFGDFVLRHPGGEQWLRYTKDTDITEAFESHHISTIPEQMLQNFYVRDASTKRNFPFTFKADGFYRTLKSRVREELKHLPKDLAENSKRIMEALTVTMFVLATITCCITNPWIKAIMSTITAMVMCWNMICAHNFLHQKDNWRMYLFNFTLQATREFRITHGFSHHMYCNTLWDVEMAYLEPFFQWLPRKSKSVIARYGPPIYAAIIFTLLFDVSFIIRTIGIFKLRQFNKDCLEDLVTFILPLFMYLGNIVWNMYLGNNANFLEVIITWLIIVHISSLITGMLNFNAAHHHPDIFHDGDKPKLDRDWGVHQLYAVMDRVDINGSLFKVLTNFGDHGLHHLFPSLDHAYLSKLYPVFLNTCKEFDTELRMTTSLDMFIGSFRQMARTKCIT